MVIKTASDASGVSICSVLELFLSHVHLRIKGSKSFPLKVTLTFHLSRLRALLKIHVVEIFPKKTSLHWFLQDAAYSTILLLLYLAICQFHFEFKELKRVPFPPKVTALSMQFQLTALI